MKREDSFEEEEFDEDGESEEPLEEDAEDEEAEEDEEEWTDPVHCPLCGSAATRLVERHYEAGLFECGECGSTFEEET